MQLIFSCNYSIKQPQLPHIHPTMLLTYSHMYICTRVCVCLLLVLVTQGILESAFFWSSHILRAVTVGVCFKVGDRFGFWLESGSGLGLGLGLGVSWGG